MLHNLLFSVWFFWPAGIATLVPVFASKLPFWRNWDSPMDGGRHYRGSRLLGDNKTWRGLIAGVIGGTLVFLPQPFIYMHSSWVQSFCPIDYSVTSILFLGFLMSLGAMLGDAFGSFLKRQSGIASGSSFFPVDQIDFIIGGLLFSALIVRLTIGQYGLILTIWVVIHLIFGFLGYLLKIKDTPL